MIQDIGAGRYRNEYRPVKPEAESRVLFYRRREVFVKCEGEKISFLSWKELTEQFPEAAGQETYLFSIDGTGYYLFRDADSLQVKMEKEHICDEQQGQVSEAVSVSCVLSEALRVFAGFTWEKLERMRTAVPKEAAFAGVTGCQLASWYAGRRFCPRCGERMVHDGKERMMRCTSCGQVEYPKISPAVIVGVTDGDRLLLTRYAGRSYKKYALIAGFAEIGETIEDTVRREVMEEVGLRVKNIRYYKSQPWSFTDTLLMGFFAELDGEGDIRLDETELAEGKWCTREEIPEDDGVSLTREMMRVFKESV